MEVLPVVGSFDPSVYICISELCWSWMYCKEVFFVLSGMSCFDVML